jgi:CheY-like chemotaxis protein
MSRPQVLIIEDNPADALLLTEALEQGGWNPAVTVAGDGRQALGRFQAEPRPELIFMDLNLPGLSGRELLGALRADPAVACIPVIILSGSAWDRAVAADHGLPDACYQVKPDSFQGYLDVAELAERIWAAGRLNKRT